MYICMYVIRGIQFTITLRINDDPYDGILLVKKRLIDYSLFLWIMILRFLLEFILCEFAILCYCYMTG